MAVFMDDIATAGKAEDIRKGIKRSHEKLFCKKGVLRRCGAYQP